MRILVIISIIMAMLLSIEMHAQGDTTILDDESIDIVKDFVPVVQRANKKHFAPTLPEVKSEVPTFSNYNLPISYQELLYTPSELKPLGLRKEEAVQLPFIYLRAGFGNYLTPLVEFRITNKNTERFRIGASLDHLSSRRKKIENQRFSETDARVNAEVYFNGMTLGIEPSYSLHNYHFYGYDQEDTTFTADETRNRYHKGGAKIYFFNHEENSLGLKYRSTLDLQALKDGYGNREFNFTWESGISKTFREIVKVGGNVLLDATSLKSIQNANRFAGGLNPYLEAGRDRWFIRGGLWALVDEGDVYILPDIRHQSKLYKDFLVIYNEWIGHLHRNSLLTVSRDNPWLMQTVKYGHHRVEKRNFVGFKGYIPVGLDYDARFSQHVYYDRPLYVNDSTIFRPFGLVYDDKIKAWNAHVSLGYQLADFLTIRAAMDYFNYNTEDERRAWHLPEFTGNLSAIYHFDNKLILEADLFIFSGVKALQPDGTIKELKGTVDVNFSANYHLNPYVAFFAQVNNAVSLKHKRLNNYPGYGFLVLGGVILSY